MKNLIWGLLAFSTLAHAQGTVTDIDGNTYDYLTYGTQQWTVENAAMETYRDGTPIPQVTDATQWSSLTTGAWCYYDNDPTKGKLYNWYAVAGIHDNDPNTPNKEFAPAGWHIPTDAEWTTLEEYLIANGYNYDGTTTGNKIAKSMASTSDWLNSTNAGAPGNNQSLNNSSNFNAFPVGTRKVNGSFNIVDNFTVMWSSTESSPSINWYRILRNINNNLERNTGYQSNGFSVRFVRSSDQTPPTFSSTPADTTVPCESSTDPSVTGYAYADDFSDLNYNFWNTPANGGDGNEPSNGNSGEHHAHITKDIGVWNDHQVGTQLKHIMESSSDLGTPSGYEVLGSYGGHFYYRSLSQSGWNEAYSSAQAAGGWLSAHETQAENTAVSQLNTTAGYVGVWIGLFQDLTDSNYSEPAGAWKWIGGATVSYQDTTSNNIITRVWTATDAVGNSTTYTQTITLTPPLAPTGDAEQTFCTTSTVADLTATGDNIQWYDAATGGNLLNSTTVLTDGQMVYASQTLNGCESTDRLEVTVSIQDITITASATEVCAGENVDLGVISELTGGLSVNQFQDNNPDLILFHTIGTHSYFYKNEAVTWPQAKSFGDQIGVSMYVINDSAEELSVYNELPFTGNDGIQYWLGLYQDLLSPDYSEPSGAWKWVDNSPLQYTNWADFEPSNGFNGEDFAQFEWYDDGIEWNDAGNNENNNSCQCNVAYPIYEFIVNSSILWSTGDTSETISVTPTETTEYWVDVTTNGVTCREYVTINVTAPAAPTGNSEQTFCTTSTIADLSATGENIQWYDAATGGNLLDSITALTDGQMVYASQTVNGCESTERLEVTVSIQDITITASATEVCAGENVDLTVSSGLAAGTTACTSADLPANLQTGLVGYWPFCGNANDESGNGNNGTVNGAILTSDRFGNTDSAYSFDGIDDFINRETNSFISNSFSFSLFVKPNSEENIYNQGFVGNTGNFTPNNCVIHPVHGAVFGDPSQNAGVGLYVGSNGIMIVEHSHNFIKVSLSHEVVINDWVNIFILYENKLPKLYINGEFIKSGVSDIRNVYASVGNDNTSYENYSNNGIGAGFNQPSQFFDGFVDDIIHWSRALNPSEIQELANSSTYTWSTGDTTANISVTPTETTEYWVDVTTNGVTCREYITINVTAPAAPTGDSEQTFCDASTVVDLTATGDNIQWYDAATGGNLLDSSTSLIDGQIVYATQTVNGCESTDRLEVTVSIQDITITASATEVCAGESVDLSVDLNLPTICDMQINLTDIPLGQEIPGFTYGGFYNEHYYYVYNDPTSWTDGEQICRENGGYLVCINDESENTFVSNLTNNNIWIGLFRDPETCEFRWLDCIDINYTNWRPGEPNSGPCGEPYAQIIRGCSFGYNTWNNLGNNSTNGACYSNMVPIMEIDPEIYQAFDPSTTYLWSTGDTTANILVSPTDTTEYWVDVTANGVTCREYVTISVNEFPDQPVSGGDISECETVAAQSLVATASANSGESITWYDAATGGSIVVDPSLSAAGTVTYYAEATNDTSGCASLTRTAVTLTIEAAPEAPVSGGDISECETVAAQSLVATASANSGESITWYDAATGGSIVVDPSLSAAGTVTYYAEVTNDTSGCVSLSRTAVTLTITSIAAPTGDAVQSFCDNVTVSDLSASGSNIQWYDAPTGGNVLDPSSALSDGQLLYASQTQNGCESITRLEVSVEIDIIPDPILITTELEFCLAREATLADLEVDEQGFALEWYDSFSGGNMLPMDTILEDGVSYYATLYDAISGCESLMRLEVVPTVIPCEVVIYNAISLNDNGINDYMVIENAEYFPDNSLEVYNRDGHLLYSQTQYGVGDNLFRGVANVSGIYGSTLSGDGPRLPTGSYLYVFKYFNPYEQQQYTLKGFLTINSN